MSDHGFANIDTFPLQVGKGDQLILLRIPKSVRNHWCVLAGVVFAWRFILTRQMNIKSLQGKKVEVKKSGKSALKGEGNDAPVYFEFADAAESNDKIFRPLVSSLIDGETRLGPEFTSSAVIQDNIVELPSIAATDANDLPVREKQNNHRIRHLRA